MFRTLCCHVILLTAIIAFIAPSQAATVTVLHSFNPGVVMDFPDTTLIQAPDGNFYGACARGRKQWVTNELGCVFKVTPAGVVTVLHGFTGTDGNWANGPLALGNDGNLYGVTQ